MFDIEDIARLRKQLGLTQAELSELSGINQSLINRLESREARLDLVTNQLKNYVPDHWLFEDEQTDSEDNTNEEPDPKQMEFDFGSGLETKH